ncbi:MAG: hypothetical protein RIC14_17380, partial [Filomicrobium sp.]
ALLSAKAAARLARASCRVSLNKRYGPRSGKPTAALRVAANRAKLEDVLFAGDWQIFENSEDRRHVLQRRRGVPVLFFLRSLRLSLSDR